MLSIVDEMLSEPAEPVFTHPHRQQLRWQPARRPGAVAPRPAHCLSPVRPAAARRQETVVR